MSPSFFVSMAFALSSLDVYYLVRDIQPALHDAFVDKVYQGSKDDDTKEDIMFRLRSPKSGKQQLYLKVPEAFFLTDHRYAWPQLPPGFCMQLRKHLQNSQLMSFEQVGFDRIIQMKFRKGETIWTIILELFGKGNIVLINDEGKIRGVLDLQRWKDRDLRVNAIYEFPKEATKTPKISLEELKNLFAGVEKDLVKFCAITLNLGGKYAEELILRANINKSKTELSDDEFSTLHGALQKLFLCDESPVFSVVKADVAPFALRSRPEYVLPEKESDEENISFSTLIEKVIVTKKVSVAKAEQKKSKNKFVDKWKRVIDDQTRAVNGYIISAEENTKKGELLYSKYQEFSELLSKIRSLQHDSGWKKVKEFIEENKLPIVVDEKNATILLEIKD